MVSERNKGAVLGEHSYLVGGLDRGEGIRSQQEPGVVVDQVEDLGVSAASQLPIGDVDLPELVGEGSFEAVEGGLGALAGLGSDQALPGQDPPDSGYRRHAFDDGPEVVGDGPGAGVMAGGGQ